jgi:hypothetical protein
VNAKADRKRFIFPLASIAYKRQRPEFLGFLHNYIAYDPEISSSLAQVGLNYA